jgi:drug/metabolite transporter (DMT)-like permease
MTPFHFGKRLTLSETQRFLLLAILIGVFAGLLAIYLYLRTAETCDSCKLQEK